MVVVVDVAAEPAGLQLAVVIQGAGSKEQPVADGRSEGARERGCSVAQQAGDRCAPAVPSDSAPVDWEPADLAAPDLVEHDFPAEAALDDHRAPAAPGDSAPVG